MPGFEEVAAYTKAFNIITVTLPIIPGMLAGLARARSLANFHCKRKAACLVCLEKNGILPPSTQKWILSSPGIHHKSAKMQGGMVRIEELLTHLRANRDCIAHQFYTNVIESLFPHLKAYLIAADDYAPDQCDGFFLP